MGTRIRHFIFPVAVAALAQAVTEAPTLAALIAAVGLPVVEDTRVVSTGRAAITLTAVALIADPEQRAALGIGAIARMEPQRWTARHENFR